MGDDLNVRIGVLTRREVEARVLAPVIDAFAAEFGRDRVVALLERALTEVARAQGRELAARQGGSTLAHFARSLEEWTREDALEIEIVEQSTTVFAFNVTRCRYAELYGALGIGDLGRALSCARDAGLIAGFNPDITLQRTQTIMDGEPYCDFVYRLTAASFPSRESTL